MPAKKIVDESEVLRWIAQGKTYAWMAEQYEKKYNLQVGLTMFSNVRRRHGIERRHTSHGDLIPWDVQPEHRKAWDMVMLRAAGRRRDGKPLADAFEARLDTWIAGLEADDAVVHYEPELGFFHVPRRKNVDTDLVRIPDSTKSPKRRTMKAAAK